MDSLKEAAKYLKPLDRARIERECNLQNWPLVTDWDKLLCGALKHPKAERAIRNMAERRKNKIVVAQTDLFGPAQIID